MSGVPCTSSATQAASDKVTPERIDRAISTVARMMVKHDMPQLIATIRFLESERAKVQQETAAMDYARDILRRNGRNKGRNISPSILP